MIRTSKSVKIILNVVTNSSSLGSGGVVFLQDDCENNNPKIDNVIMLVVKIVLFIFLNCVLNCVLIFIFIE